MKWEVGKDYLLHLKVNNFCMKWDERGKTFVKHQGNSNLYAVGELKYEHRDYITIWESVGSSNYYSPQRLVCIRRIYKGQILKVVKL